MFQKNHHAHLKLYGNFHSKYSISNLRHLCTQMPIKFSDQWKTSPKTDPYSLASILASCIELNAITAGKQIHSTVIKGGIGSRLQLATSLFHLYHIGGSLAEARQVFDEMRFKHQAFWTAIISGYLQHGNPKEALVLSSKMLNSGISLNLPIFRFVLKASARVKSLKHGAQIHAHLIRNQLLPDMLFGNGLIDMYAKCGSISYARFVFDEMPRKDVVSCNSMISGYTNKGFEEEAMKLFSEMHFEDIRPDGFTFATILGACAGLTSIQQGGQIHASIVKSGFDSDRVLGISLVDMYAKCGNIKNARRVFEFMPEKDVISWTAVLTAYGKHGLVAEVIDLFEQMKKTGIKPDGVSYLAVLTACSHAGLREKGWYYFNNMLQDASIKPRQGHYACMIDLLGRAGCINEAYEFIKNMPLKPSVTVWGALLSACQAYGHMELGKIAAKAIMELDPRHAGVYVILSNMYATSGNWAEAVKLRNTMKRIGVKKEPGCSWIEIKNKVHVFPVGDRSHPQILEIFAVLEKLAGQMKEAGYIPMTRFYTQSSSSS